MAAVLERVLLAGLLCLQGAATAGADTTSADTQADRIHSNGKTALMVAARNGDRARVEKLIGRGADVNQANNNGGSPIMYAALSGDPGTVSLLLRHGADAGSPAKNGWTALMIASAKGYVEIARILLRHGTDPNQPDVYSWTPLMRAAYEDRTGVVGALLDNEATEVDRRGENGMTALHLAVVKRNSGIVRRLLAHGADPYIEDDDGRTAQDLARKNNDLQLERLIRAGLGD